LIAAWSTERIRAYEHDNLPDGTQVLGVLRLAEDEWIRHMRSGV
jgi:hypothetical protein